MEDLKNLLNYIQKLELNFSYNHDQNEQDKYGYLLACGDIEIKIKSMISFESKTEESPKLVGWLNKQFGYNGFYPAEIGTEVLEFRDRYYFEIKSIKDNSIVKQKFYKETLKPCINFITK